MVGQASGRAGGRAGGEGAGREGDGEVKRVFVVDILMT